MTLYLKLLEHLLQEYKGIVLVFSRTKYGTKKITDALHKKGIRAAEIHSNRSLAQRRAALQGFKDGRYRVLVATDIAARGIDVKNIELVVNYDLPWNPMRLVQRVGRLYRYGQKKKVVVINLHVPNSIDNDILTILYQRLYQVVHDMASLGEEFRPGIEDEILGQMAEVLDLEDILHIDGIRVDGAGKVDLLRHRNDFIFF